MKLKLCAAVLLLAASFGCDQYVEMRNISNRIWVMNKDGSKVLRCYDATPPGQYKGALKAFCKEAHMYGTVDNPDQDPNIVIPAESTQTPSLPTIEIPAPQTR